VNEGSSPKMTSSTTGMPMPPIGLIGRRQVSRASFSTIFPNALRRARPVSREVAGAVGVGVRANESVFMTTPLP